MSDDSDEEKAEKEEFQKQLKFQYDSERRTKAEKQEFQKQLNQKYLEFKAAAEDGKDSDSDDENDDGFQIIVKNFTGKTLTFDVKPTDTIDNLKGQIKVKEGITFKFRLVTGGKQLEDNRIVSYYKIEKSSTLHMLRWLKGGGKVLIFSWKSFL